MTLGFRIINPKPNRACRSSANWYRYYPCFSEEFARLVLASASLQKEQWVLDPWNGSGTTTSRARALGLNAYGYDLNPVMVLIAKARILSPGDYPSIRPLLADIRRKSSKAFDICPKDPLLAWLVPRSVSRIRATEAAVQKLLIDELSYSSLRSRGVEQVSALASFFYVALFRTLRQLLRSFLTSNPTWTKRPRDHRCRLRPKDEAIDEALRAEIGKMLLVSPDRPESAGPGKSRLGVSSSEALPLSNGAVDLVLSSPPYCTRIDYAVATSIELAILGYTADGDLDQLRRSLIGSTTVPRGVLNADGRWGPTCLQFLKRLFIHDAKASSTYYYKNHLQYFRSIHRSLCEVSRVLKDAAACVLVVQDSYYKNVHNNLPQIVAEMGAECGLPVRQRYDFPLSRTMAGINPGACEYRSSFPATESVLVMSKSRPVALGA